VRLVLTNLDEGTKAVDVDDVFARVQDLSGHKISRWVAPQPLILRSWLTPFRYQGTVWAVQVSTNLTRPQTTRPS
jgi:hypothetical protein